MGWNAVFEPMTDEKRFMNVIEVAGYLGLSRWTIYDLVSKRSIPFIPLSRKALRFDRQKIDKWMEKKEVKTLSQALADLDRTR